MGGQTRYQYPRRLLESLILTKSTANNGVARTLKKLRTPKGDYCIKQCFSTITSLFKLGISLKGKNLLPEGANLFLGANSFF